MLFISSKNLFSFSTFLIMQEDDLIRKLRLISKYTMSQTGKKIAAIHILLNISKSKGNQTIKFG